MTALLSLDGTDFSLACDECGHLMQARNRAAANHRRTCIVGASRSVLSALRLLCLDTEFPNFVDHIAALQWLRRRIPVPRPADRVIDDRTGGRRDHRVANAPHSLARARAHAAGGMMQW
ncbi:hypothetical protein [Dactylosporangium maewongense]|uniref:hypothetical protein n=1 Tax=Dactylosporangium maewongense TaxID=634393 RepID=UPI0031DC9A0F